MLTKAKQALDSRKKELQRKQSENALLNRQITAFENRIMTLVESLQISQEGLNFLEELANSRRGGMKGKIESVVSEALRLIYGDSYGVELSYSMKNNRSCLEIEMTRNIKAGQVHRDMDGFGGGVADTISVPLRLMVLVGSKKTDKIVILDECWKHVDEEKIEPVGIFLKMLSEKLHLQVLFCTHHQPLRSFADVVFDIEENDGVSSVTSKSRI